MTWIASRKGAIFINTAFIAKIEISGLNIIACIANSSPDPENSYEEIILWKGAEYGDAENMMEEISKELKIISFSKAT
jgi:hypothetical protein